MNIYTVNEVKQTEGDRFLGCGGKGGVKVLPVQTEPLNFS